MASLIEQVETMSYTDLEKLVTALKRKPEKTSTEKLEERIDTLEDELESLRKSQKSLENSISMLLICLIIGIFVFIPFQGR